jgi:hypothetical protein
MGLSHNFTGAMTEVTIHSQMLKPWPNHTMLLFEQIGNTG